MQLLHYPNPTKSRERAAVLGGRLRRALVPCVLVAATIPVIGCGSSEAPTILNTEKIERAIERSALAQRGTRTQVTCPSGVQQKQRLVFSCTAVSKGGSTRFVVTQLDASGHVHYAAR
jgi:hypothetical protein